MEKPEEVLDRYKADRLYRNEKGLLFAESNRGTQLICSQLCPSIRCGESYTRRASPLPTSVKSALLSGNWDEPKSITRPELPDPPEPETVTFGEYVEITELLDINKLLDINCPLCGNKTTVIYSQTLGGMDWYECFDCNAIFGIWRKE